MPMIWLCRLGMVLLLLGCATVANELGVSLQLEGRMACRRGITRIIDWQSANGSWQQSVALSAHAAFALAAAGDGSPEALAARQRAQVYVGDGLAVSTTMLSRAANESVPLPVGYLAMVLRWFLREGSAAPLEMQKQWRSASATGAVPAAEAMVVIEVLLLQQQGMQEVAAPGAIVTAEVLRVERLLERLVAGRSAMTSVGERLAMEMAMGDAGAGSAARQRLEEIVDDVCGDNFAEMYWLSRVFYAQAATDGGHAWRAPLLTELLARQRGDGGWGCIEDNLAQRIGDSAWALQTLALLLADQSRGE